MKKTICFLMLVTGITGAAYAQDGSKLNSDKIFEQPANNAKKRFVIELKKGNKMQIELSDMADLNQFSNMDSVLRVFLKDIEPLKDSFSDELSSKRIDYTTDSSGRAKIRIQQFKPKGSSFLVKEGDVAALKLEQDTVNFIGMISFFIKPNFSKKIPQVRYYRVSLFVNNLSELTNYMDGRLNAKIKELQKNNATPWVKGNDGQMHLKEDYAISAKLPKGDVAGGDFLAFRLSVDVQNYKKYFVPSFSLGAALIISNSFFKREVGLFWEPNFLFGTTSQGKLTTYRNDFITLTLGQGGIRDNDPRKDSYLITILSLGYLVNRQGDYFEKGTLRLGAGRLSLFEGKTKIEPALYFTGLFKGVTPGLRWIQGF